MEEIWQSPPKSCKNLKNPSTSETDFFHEQFHKISCGCLFHFLNFGWIATPTCYVCFFHTLILVSFGNIPGMTIVQFQFNEHSWIIWMYIYLEGSFEQWIEPVWGLFFGKLVWQWNMFNLGNTYLNSFSLCLIMFRCHLCVESKSVSIKSPFEELPRFLIGTSFDTSFEIWLIKRWSFDWHGWTITVTLPVY